MTNQHTEYPYPTMARMLEFNFDTITVNELWFNTHAEALKHYNSNRENGKIHFSPIVILEVQR